MDNTNKTQILIVDDDEALCDLLCQYLKKQGFPADYVEDGMAMDRYLEQTTPALIILDLMMPGEDGLSIAKRLTSEQNIPIIMLSACGEDVDRILGLEMGADDYLAKPFNTRELLARIRSVLRRHHPEIIKDNKEKNRFSFGANTLDILSQVLTQKGKKIPLTQGEYSLLKLFLENPNRVLSRDTLLENLKGYECSPFDRSVDVRVARLRHKIETDTTNPEFIQTVWGQGYKFLLADREE
ncbi:MAG: response regulator [Methylococcaceae bacterium]|nr:response regulator [Methylococcaceae bacterium]